MARTRKAAAAAAANREVALQGDDDEDASRRTSGPVSTFVQKVFDMTSNEEYNQFIRFSADGMSFVITGTAGFAENVLPQYFKHRNLSSFIRQLNLYGYSKKATVHRSRDRMEFVHPLFQRGKPHLIPQIKRRTSDSSKRASALMMRDVGELRGKVAELNDSQRMLVTALRNLLQDNQALWDRLNESRSDIIQIKSTVNGLCGFLSKVYQGIDGPKGAGAGVSSSFVPPPALSVPTPNGTAGAALAAAGCGVPAGIPTANASHLTQPSQRIQLANATTPGMPGAPKRQPLALPQVANNAQSSRLPPMPPLADGLDDTPTPGSADGSSPSPLTNHAPPVPTTARQSSMLMTTGGSSQRQAPPIPSASAPSSFLPTNSAAAAAARHITAQRRQQNQQNAHEQHIERQKQQIKAHEAHLKSLQAQTQQAQAQQQQHQMRIQMQQQPLLTPSAGGSGGRDAAPLIPGAASPAINARRRPSFADILLAGQHSNMISDANEAQALMDSLLQSPDASRAESFVSQAFPHLTSPSWSDTGLD